MDNYYKKMAAESNATSQKKLDEKEEELRVLFSEVIMPKKTKYKLAVLGCGDKRHLAGNTKIFEEILGTEIENYTYDLDVKHLGKGAKKHDCTKELPENNFDITYAHVLLKFIPQDLQLELIKNSYRALESTGVAIHIIDSNNIKPDKQGIISVDFESIEEYLTESGIDYKLVGLRYGFGLVLIRA